MSPKNFGTDPKQLELAHSSFERIKGTITYETPDTYVPLKRNQGDLPEIVGVTFRSARASLDEAQYRTFRNDYILKLDEAGWVSRAIGTACGLSHESVREIIKTKTYSGETFPYAPIMTFPTPPTRMIPAHGIKYTEPTPEVLERLKELQPFANKVRSHSPKYRAEAEEYTALLNKAITEQGVTQYRLAKLLGISNGAIAFRLTRYGYKPLGTGTSKTYQKIIDKNRAK